MAQPAASVPTRRVEPINSTAPHAQPAVEPLAHSLPDQSTTPATNEDIENNMHEIKDLHRCYPEFLNKIIKAIDWVGKTVVWIAGHPLFWLGCGMMVFGVGHAVFSLAWTLSVEALYPTLPILLMGGLFFCFGKYMRENNVDGLNYTLGNLLYIPLRWPTLA